MEQSIKTSKLKRMTRRFYLKRRQNDPGDVDLWDENVSGDLPDVLQKAQIQILVLEPGQLQIAVHVSAVGVPIAQIPIVVLPVVRHRHPASRSDANWKKINLKLDNAILIECGLKTNY